MTLTLEHKCPDGFVVRWVEDFAGAMVICPFCWAAFVYVAETGWSELVATP